MEEWRAPHPWADSNKSQMTTAELAARAGLPRIAMYNTNTEADRAVREITWAAMSARQKEAMTLESGVRIKPFPYNAAIYPPPSLDKFRTAASRAPADAPPVLWYWQMTGETWDRQTHSYRVCSAGASKLSTPPAHSTGSIRVGQLARKAHLRMLPDNIRNERYREANRERKDRTKEKQEYWLE